MTSARDVWELSHAILGDRDGFVAVLRYYMDESGTHDGSPVVTVSCCVARPKVWAAFTKAWNAKKKPIKVFHAADCQNLREEFEGWTDKERDDYVKELLPVIPRFDICGEAIGINLKEFEEAIAPHPDLRDLFGTPYSSCFHWCVRRALHTVQQHGCNECLAFFHEQNDFRREAMEQFDWIKKHREK